MLWDIISFIILSIFIIAFIVLIIIAIFLSSTILTIFGGLVILFILFLGVLDRGDE